MAERARLGAGELHVWIAEPGAHPPEAAWEELLDDEEHARRERLRPAARGSFAVSHALVRRSLSRYASTPPGVWRFRTVARGRPEVAHPDTDLRFNLSHTKGLAACGVVRTRDVGIDVEGDARVLRHLRIAERYFSAREIRALRELPEARQPQHFLDVWTLKEAYLKARGLGLGIPLAGFSFVLGGAAPELVPERDLGERPGDWQFALVRPTPQHRLAIAVRRGDAPPLRIRVERDEALCASLRS